MSTQSTVEKNLHQRADAEHARATNPIAERVEELRDHAQTLYERSKTRAIEFEHRFEEKVREHPVRSVAIAAGIGAGIGLLIGVLAARR